jgi:hypothetical protein
MAEAAARNLIFHCVLKFQIKEEEFLLAALLENFLKYVVFHEMCHLTLFYFQWSQSVTAFGLFRLGNKSGGIYCVFVKSS